MRGTIAHTFKLVWRFRQLEEPALRARRGGKSEECPIKGLSQQPHPFLGFGISRQTRDAESLADRDAFKHAEAAIPREEDFRSAPSR
jgi:hypothetical protein